MSSTRVLPRSKGDQRTPVDRRRASVENSRALPGSNVRSAARLPIATPCSRVIGRRSRVLNPHRHLPVAPQACFAPVRRGDHDRSVGDQPLGVAGGRPGRVHPPDREFESGQPTGVARIGHTADQQRARDAARACISHPLEQVTNGRNFGACVWDGHEHAPSGPADHHSQGRRDYGSADDETEPAAGERTPPAVQSGASGCRSTEWSGDQPPRARWQPTRAEVPSPLSNARQMRQAQCRGAASSALP